VAGVDHDPLRERDHTLTATVRDATGRTGGARIAVTVKN
jgi:hypothetical protein